MIQTLPSSLHTLINRLSDRLGQRLDADSLRPVTTDPTAATARDATLALHITSASGPDYVLLLSHPEFPNTVQQAVDRARSIAAHLHAPLNAPVTLPRIEGSYEGRSFGLFTALEPFSTSRPLRFLQKAAVAVPVTEWLRDIALHTRTAPLSETECEVQFHAPLTYLTEDPEIDAPVKALAADCLEHLDQVPQCGFNVAAHGDFWIGNIMFKPSRIPGRHGPFRAIDWGGARLDGYPGLDLMRFCLSAFGPDKRRPRQMVHDYIAALGIAPQHAALYPMAALGRLGLNLNQFPKDRYLALMQRIYSFADACDLIDPARISHPAVAVASGSARPAYQKDAA